MTWQCRVCDSENDDEDEVCLGCGSYRNESCYDVEDDLESEEEED